MLLSWIRRTLKKKSRPLTRSIGKPNDGRFMPAVELLDERVLLWVTASFAAALFRRSRSAYFAALRVIMVAISAGAARCLRQ